VVIEYRSFEIDLHAFLYYRGKTLHHRFNGLHDLSPFEVPISNDVLLLFLTCMDADRDQEVDSKWSQGG